VISLQEISKKPCEEFKIVNSILLTKYCSHRTEISTKDIVTRASMGMYMFSNQFAAKGQDVAECQVAAECQVVADGHDMAKDQVAAEGQVAADGQV